MAKKTDTKNTTETNETMPDMTDIVVAEASVRPVLATLPAECLGSKFLTQLPHLRDVLADLRDPTPDEILAAASELTGAEKEGFAKWLMERNPKKIGLHTANSEFTIPDLRIFQGQGNDAARPANSVKGCVYASDGNLLTAPGQQSMMLGVPERFEGIVIGLHSARMMWPPKDPQGNNIPMQGIDTSSNLPICRSMDRITGSRYGSCATCEWLPFSTGTNRKNECKDEWHVYVVKADFSAIYRIVMTSTSIKSGATPIEQRTKGWPQLFSKYFIFEAAEQKNAKLGATWFAWKSAVSISAAAPLGKDTPASSQKLLELLARKIDAVRYIPTLAGIYAENTGGGAAAQLASGGGVADMEAVLGAMSPASNL